MSVHEVKKSRFEPDKFFTSSGLDPVEWLKKYELYIRLNKVGEQEKIDILEFFLIEKDVFWFKKNIDLMKDWDSTKTLFLERFGGKESEVRAWNMLKTLKYYNYDEFEDFEFQISHYAKLAGLEDKETKLRLFLSALNPEYHKLVLRKKLKTYHEAVNLIFEEEGLNKAVKRDINVETPSNKADQQVNKQIVKVHKPDKDEMYEALIERFDKLSISLLSKIGDSKQQKPRRQWTTEEKEKELTDLFKKIDAKELRSLSKAPTSVTNCKALVEIFDNHYVSVIDLCAACSVASKEMLQELGIKVDNKSTQVIVTVDGTRHNNLGKATNLPIKIAGYVFPVDLVIMEKSANALILGTEWLTRHKATIDLNSMELTLPVENYDVLLSLSTKGEVQGYPDNLEYYAIAKEVHTPNEEEVLVPQEELNTFLGKYTDLFVTDVADLKQTTLTQHSIDTGSANPVKVKPYMKPYHMKNENAQ
ncbi:hypothetical protein BB560_006262 [Smittium megazygosporum]|uniref:Retrotransposon gag domain-containing protein n=1 Tax=Smittium megazygosporum TaxID=133381 RepID=A0A2T9YC65_9FUNG|nr:hypothetical protein BB560_006262 [Smittium megazygosporum]